MFLSNMSHEIRTPLNAILGYAHILQRSTTLQPAEHDAVDTIEDSGEHLLGLIDDILDLSRIESGRMEVQNRDFDLTGLIEGLSVMFELRCEQKGLEWSVEWESAAEEQRSGGAEGSPQLPYPSAPLRETGGRMWVHGDEGKLRQVLINLCSNGVKFTDTGEVRLTIRESTTDDQRSMTDEVRSSVVGRRSSVFTFEVIDTGVGIPPQEQATILEPFEQGSKGREQGGTGLGLTIARRMVALMGGTLSLESEAGGGSRFFFTVPLSPAQGEIPSSFEEKRRVVRLSEGVHVKALVADDAQDNRDVLCRILSEIGVEGVTARDGGEAVEQVRAHAPDIVFMDIRMPVLDGIEAAQRIFAEFGRDRLTMVAISASALAHERERYLGIGFDAFISKPFLAEQIYDCLARFLQVEYEYADAEESPASVWEVSELQIPRDLILRLREAARRHQFTELKDALREVEALGEEGHGLVDRVRPLLQRYDMTAMLDLLSEITDE
jgi:CheY-like chemotaxis protein